VGRGIALALAGEGAPVAVLDRAEETLGDTCAEIERRGGTAVPVLCDVRDLRSIQAAVRKVLQELGALRILVNNAQFSPHGTLLEISEEAVDDGWRTGPLAAFRFMRTCHPYLRDGGSIVNISSGAAATAGPNGLAAYAAVKAAIQSFSRAAAVEWASDGIRVNTLFPLVASPGYEEWKMANPEANVRSMQRIPMQRLGDAELDAGRAVVFLVGPDASMITGAALAVDGGGTYLR
jgi:NAD(P)-dependent dehydrogenase (short-subunit alcohol dehydrogenase family)